MKYIDLEKIHQLPGRRVLEHESFSFRCHSELACFNRCCRNLNLFLYPYDVIRLKNRLGISSDEFLECYTDAVLRPSEFFPEVLLRMADNDEKTCPFLTDAGCSVYSDRPDACRSFPIEQGFLYNAQTQSTEPVYWFKPPEFCLGQHETAQWTPKTWAADQHAEIYTRMTSRWAMLRARFQINPWGAEGPHGRRAKMTFMASYNIDRFRDFVFESTFLKRYAVKPDIRKKLKSDDTRLLKFALEWIAFFLWGIPSSDFKSRS